MSPLLEALLAVLALLAGGSVIVIAFCWLEPEEMGRLSEGWKRRMRREP
jgi:hypothetical protein